MLTLILEVLRIGPEDRTLMDLGLCADHRMSFDQHMRPDPGISADDHIRTDDTVRTYHDARLEFRRGIYDRRRMDLGGRERLHLQHLPLTINARRCGPSYRPRQPPGHRRDRLPDRKSTRLNSSHVAI